jgi:hypothetical protein
VYCLLGSIEIFFVAISFLLFSFDSEGISLMKTAMGDFQLLFVPFFSSNILRSIDDEWIH